MKRLRPFLSLFTMALWFCICGFAAPNEALEPPVRLEVNEGFCPNGAVVPLVPLAGDPSALNFWGAFCKVPQKKPLVVRTSSFLAPQYLRIYISGYADLTLALQRVADGSKFFLFPWDTGRWQAYDFSLPPAWRGEPVRLIADYARENDLFLAFSEPLKGIGKVPAGLALDILSRTCLHFFAIMLCALALAAVAILRGLRNVVYAGVIALAGTAVPGYCVFWLTLLSPVWGRYAAVLVLGAAVAGLSLCLRRLDSEGRRILKALLSPILLTGAVTLLVLSTGFLYGGERAPLALAAVRFSHPLPPDNQLPYLLAQRARGKQMPKTFFADWLSSDRPPLQAGVVLSQFPLFYRPLENGYLTVSVLLQSLWIFALWLLLTAFGLKSRAVILALAACLFSGFVFLNSFYVWPKLMAAAYTIGFLAAFVAPKPSERSFLQSWIAPGALLCFGMLSHGGTVFALLAMAPLILLFRRPWQIRRMFATALFAFVLYLPWIFYQNFYDPPGDRLLKYHLAGVEKLDPRSFLQVVAGAYGALSLRQIVDYKEANFAVAFSRGTDSLKSSVILLAELVSPGPSGLSTAARRAAGIRGEAFFHIVPCLGFFGIAPFGLIIGLAKRFRSIEWRTACILWILVFGSIVVWCLLMFGPGTTVIHAGAYATVLLAIAASVLSLWALSARLALLVSLLQMALSFFVNGPAMRILIPNGLLPEGILHVDTLVLCLLSFAAVVALLWKLAQRKPDVATASVSSS